MSDAVVILSVIFRWAQRSARHARLGRKNSCSLYSARSRPSTRRGPCRSYPSWTRKTWLWCPLCLSNGIGSRWRRTMHRRSSQCRPNCDLHGLWWRMRDGIQTVMERAITVLRKSRARRRACCTIWSIPTEDKRLEDKTRKSKDSFQERFICPHRSMWIRYTVEHVTQICELLYQMCLSGPCTFRLASR